MSRRQVKVRVSAELVLSALGFPDGAQLMTCDDSFLVKKGTLDLYVTHPDLPVLVEGQEPVLITPTITIVGPKPSEYLAFDWNLPND